MKEIVYAIAEAQQTAREPLPLGLGQAPLGCVQHGHLSAILSPVTEELASASGVEQLVEYARVVEQLHRRLTVLPMRYGCFVHGPEQAAEFLRRNEQPFSQALVELEGCDEMGVRILVEDSVPHEGEETDSRGQAKGRAYLDRRRQFYEQKARADAASRQWADRLQAAFSGLFVRCTWEHVERPGGQLLSFSFLVKRPELEAFRNAFRRFQQDSPSRAVCSGPWPPYAFVAGLGKSGLPAQADLDSLLEQR